jgi:26S proteasome regulatory subunit N3
MELSNITVKTVQELNRRSLDQLAAKVYFYYARFYELTGRLAEIRPTLLNAQRTATLRRDDDTQSTLINLLLRNYFHYNLYDQADKLVSKTTFPENATNNQLARYMYYFGRIKAIQLEYTESHQSLLQAVRKAPQNNVTAGFQQEVCLFFHASVVNGWYLHCIIFATNKFVGLITSFLSYDCRQTSY